MNNSNVTYSRKEVAKMLGLNELSIWGLIKENAQTWNTLGKGLLVEPSFNRITAESLLAEIERRLKGSRVTWKSNQSALEASRGRIMHDINARSAVMSAKRISVPISRDEIELKALNAYVELKAQYKAQEAELAKAREEIAQLTKQVASLENDLDLLTQPAPASVTADEYALLKDSGLFALSNLD